MKKRLDYFKYEGKIISLRKLHDMEEYLTESMNFINDAYKTIGDKINKIHNLIWPVVEGNTITSMNHKMYELHKDELNLLGKNRKRYYADFDSLNKTRNILRRYRLLIK